MTDLNRKSSKFIGSKTGGCRKLIGHASEIAETPKGHSLSKVQLGRYVQVISLDISTLSEPLRWAFTLIGGMPPCWKAWFEKLEHCWNSKIANLKEKSVSQKLRSSSFSTERVRKIRHRVTRCLHTHAPRRGQIIYIAASALSGRLNVDWLGMIGRAVSETGAIEPAAADVPRGDLDLGRMLLNVRLALAKWGYRNQSR